MKYILIIITLVFSIQTAYSKLQGQAKVDSLLKELTKMKEDTNGVNLLSTLSYELYSINPDKGIEYGLLGVKLLNSPKIGLHEKLKNIPQLTN